MPQSQCDSEPPDVKAMIGASDATYRRLSAPARRVGVLTDPRCGLSVAGLVAPVAARSDRRTQSEPTCPAGARSAVRPRELLQRGFENDHQPTAIASGTGPGSPRCSRSTTPCPAIVATFARRIAAKSKGDLRRFQATSVFW